MKKQIFTAIIVLSASVSYGQSLVQFQNGTVADADDVNANFASLKTEVTANATAASKIVSSPWSTSGDDISYTSGNIGIGSSTISPETRLQIENGKLQLFRIDESDAGLRSNVTVQNQVDQYVQLEVRGSQETGSLYGIPLANTAYVRATSFGGTDLENFIIGSNKADLILVSNNAERVRIDGQGNVGIGISNPSVPLHVKGTVNDTDGHIIIETFQTSGTARDPKLEFRDAGGERLMILGQQLDGTGVPIHTQLTNYQNGNIEFRNINTTLMLITSSGNVGIGNASPVSKLAVSGLPTSAPDSSGNAGIVCATNNGNFWLDNDGVADCL